MRSIILICSSLLALLTLDHVSAGGIEHAYLVKPRKVNSVPEALTIMKHFVPYTRSFDERCQRYAVLLKNMIREPMDQFSIVELAISKVNTISNQYKAIDVETLRHLYIDAINQSLQGHIDSSMVELVDCLIRKFRSHDAKAFSFLNGDELKDTLNQYKSIMDQPMTLLNDKTSKHPTLTSAELTPAIKRLLVDLFGGDVRQVEARFPSNPMAVAASNIEDIPLAGASAAAGDAQAGTTAWLASDENLGSEEIEYLNRLISSLRAIFPNLAYDTSISDRCEAYGKVIDADSTSLTQELVDSIIQRTPKLKQGQVDQERSTYLPSKDTRENFLVALNAFAPEQRDVVWIDIIECLAGWEKEDEDVSSYLNSPELTKIVDDLLKKIREQESSQ